MVLYARIALSHVTESFAKRLGRRWLCLYRPRLFSLTYSSIFRRATGGRLGNDKMRFMTVAEGPARLSRLSTAQVVLAQVA